ncbi:hypothetical protein Tco_0064996 [Tanacetum coccineum]
MHLRIDREIRVNEVRKWETSEVELMKLGDVCLLNDHFKASCPNGLQKSQDLMTTSGPPLSLVNNCSPSAVYFGVSITPIELDLSIWSLYDENFQYGYFSVTEKDNDMNLPNLSWYHQVQEGCASLLQQYCVDFNSNAYLQNQLNEFWNRRSDHSMDKLKNHKKAVKNEQARTREPEEYKAEARKAKHQSKSAKVKRLENKATTAYNPMLRFDDVYAFFEIKTKSLIFPEHAIRKSTRL